MVTTNTTQKETKAMPEGTTAPPPVRVILDEDVYEKLQDEAFRNGLPPRLYVAQILAQRYRSVSGNDEILDKTTGN